MNSGFVKIACATPDIKVADCEHNAEEIVKMIFTAKSRGAKLIAFPELCLTGSTCGDLFFQHTLIQSTKKALSDIINRTKDLDILIVIGLPYQHKDKLYDCGAFIYKGRLLGLVPNNGSVEGRSRYFESKISNDCVQFNGYSVHFGTNIIFVNENMPEFKIGIEISADLLLGGTSGLVKAGATLIINLSASHEIVGASENRRTIVKAKSRGLLCAYAHVNSGIGESTTDLVFAGHNLIAENGVILSESELFKSGICYADIDFQILQSERIRSTEFILQDEGYRFELFSMEKNQINIERKFSQMPFIPNNKDEIDKFCFETYQIQVVGLASRMKHIGCKRLILGLSGGLDSTLALIVAVHTMDMLGLDRKGIIAVVMPCFGTSDRTYNNACRLAEAYGITLKEINIKDSVLKHFEDIGQEVNNHDSTYENAQARERTQILMDIANQQNGLLIGTGDLSELALGWTTYNADHMSMYSLNASIPKTLVRYMVSFEAKNSNEEIKAVLMDINQTPISPELLPPTLDGSISQKTEDIVGPYELHDFLLYYVVRYGFEPKKIYRMAKLAFDGIYTGDVILKWQRVFYRRFFSQQFKRSCSPDGVKTGNISLSPRGSFIMPSDACVNAWLKSLDECEE